MEGRFATNLLLAVIAGVLLFGREAMIGGVKGAAIGLIIIAVLYGIFSLANYLLGEVVKTYREAEDWKEAAVVTFGVGTGCVLVLLSFYVGWLWLSGESNPMDAAINPPSV